MCRALTIHTGVVGEEAIPLRPAKSKRRGAKKQQRQQRRPAKPSPIQINKSQKPELPSTRPAQHDAQQRVARWPYLYCLFVHEHPTTGLVIDTLSPNTEDVLDFSLNDLGPAPDGPLRVPSCHGRNDTTPLESFTHPACFTPCITPLVMLSATE
jgi:hypothetical protein